MAGQGMLLTCDCVSLEKREGTLGLLFLTDLSGFDIITGKMTAQVSRSLYCLLAALPALGFCILLGGVALGDFVVVALGLLNTLFYFAALGLLISVWIWREQTAMAWGGLALLVLGFLFPILCVMGNSTASLVWVPPGTLFSAPSFPAGISPPNAVASLLVSHAMGWLFMAAASWLVPRSWAPTANVRLHRRISTVRQTRTPFHVPTPWLTEPGNGFLTTVLPVIICSSILLANLFGPPGMTQGVALIAIVLMHSVLKYQAASQAAHMLAGKRRSGELEILLTTPYDEDDILHGCFQQLIERLYWPTLFALVVDLTLLTLGCFNDWLGFGLGWLFIVVVEVIWMLVNLHSLCWVGLFQGVKLGNPAKATGRAIFNVVLLPWIVGICFTGLAVMLAHGDTAQAASFITVAVFLGSLAFCNFYFTGVATSELRDSFRYWATQT